MKKRIKSEKSGEEGRRMEKNGGYGEMKIIDN